MNIEPAYLRGLQENAKRESMGLRKIGRSWICYRSLNGEDEWAVEQKSTAADKITTHDAKGFLLSETDRYWSGRIASMGDSKFQEEIKLQCDYQAQKLRLIYLGDDQEIEGWIENTATNNQNCLEVLEQIKTKWFRSADKQTN